LALPTGGGCDFWPLGVITLILVFVCAPLPAVLEREMMARCLMAYKKWCCLLLLLPRCVNT
jgi:hypothetical protein